MGGNWASQCISDAHLSFKTEVEKHWYYFFYPLSALYLHMLGVVGLFILTSRNSLCYQSRLSLLRQTTWLKQLKDRFDLAQIEVLGPSSASDIRKAQWQLLRKLVTLHLMSGGHSSRCIETAVHIASGVRKAQWHVYWDSCSHCFWCQEGTMAGVEAAVHTASDVRNQTAMNTETSFTFSFLFSLRSQPKEWCHPQTQ